MDDKARSKALNILYNIYKGAFSNIELNKRLNASNLDSRDKAFITELVYGTLKWTITLDYVIKSYSKIKENKISPWIKAILRMGLYQIFFMSRVPNSAACNESVKLAGRYGHRASRGFVNGLLRNVIRETDGKLENIVFPDKSKKPVEYLAYRYGYQIWMIETLLKQFEFNFVEDILKSDLEEPDVTIRVNRLKINKEELINIFQSKGIEWEVGRYCDDALILNKPSSIKEIDEFKEGLFTVQGESSMLAVLALGPKPYDNVLDMCAAPGGKTTYIAELMENKGRIEAWDIFPHRVDLINETSSRLGIDIINTRVSDAAVFNKEFENVFDKILVDAPCSGLGIIRKKPDIKLTRSKEDIEKLVAIQKEILNTASRYVKPGGVIVYSTCTILDEENIDVINDFLKSHSNFKLCDFGELLPETLPGRDRANKGYLNLNSNMGKLDGFFIAKLVRLDGDGYDE